ncbi:MAG: hypothetical protein HC890_11320 [Chloroflexaceae bacterium]|nr:hypothetical protein [Chloroflexaceae bacterium]
MLCLASAVGSSLSAIAAVRGLRWWRFSPALERLRDVLGLIILGALLSPGINATIDVGARVGSATLSWRQFALNWWIVWLGDCTGILVFAPLLLQLAFVYGNPHLRYRPRRF